jgi:hypothetical protein
MKLFFTLFFAFVLFNVNAQNTYPFPSSGNVGIGTTSPLSDPLNIRPSTDGKGLMILPSSTNPNTGNYMQLASHPYYNYIFQMKANAPRLDIIGNNQLFLFANDIFFQGNAVVTRSNDGHPSSVGTSVSSGAMPFETNLYSSATGAGVITYAGLQNVASTTIMGGHRIAFKMKALQSNLSDGTEVLSIQSNGTVGINTTDTISNYKLAVNGAAIFTKAVVKTYNTWADYVFDESYQLPTLNDIEQYIKLHKHLPEMPTTAEVEKDGIDLGNNQALLLKKVEQLTLYMIDQNKRLEVQQKQIEHQQQQIEQLTGKQ